MQRNELTDTYGLTEKKSDITHHLPVGHSLNKPVSGVYTGILWNRTKMKAISMQCTEQALQEFAKNRFSATTLCKILIQQSEKPRNLHFKRNS